VTVAVYAEIFLLGARVVYCYAEVHIFITHLGTGANKTVCLSKSAIGLHACQNGKGKFQQYRRFEIIARDIKYF
jgi:butyrate kinase